MKPIEKIKNLFKSQQLPASYKQRSHNRTIWEETFSGHFETAEKTLKIFCSAFLFPAEERFKLRPSDKIYEIYRAIYPSKCTPDALEYTFLIEEMEKEFVFKFTDKDSNEIQSLRDLVNKAITAQQAGEPDC